MSKKPRPLPRGVPCPKCGAGSRVLRVTKGERIRSASVKRDYVRRERICFAKAHHKFVTEERPR